ncbi:hypothetical protein EPIR_2647 [Erwinia piriflorinigrans CFBP 5888]|uniref:Uncharacterized protein n=1 Tax=Erwinia piriflorinigrans CFBP 5888 TaxID=1161919 RepID=V5Z9W7_9GAMM|nr:hypothetical protein EPIR_2647 [Erwinia piriflorinigrans CFBP 5888]
MPYFLACASDGCHQRDVPFLLMQPCLGNGIAAAKTPAPWLGRRRNLVAHVSFGLGRWLSAWLLAFPLSKYFRYQT